MHNGQYEMADNELGRIIDKVQTMVEATYQRPFEEHVHTAMDALQQVSRNILY